MALNPPKNALTKEHNHPGSPGKGPFLYRDVTGADALPPPVDFEPSGRPLRGLNCVGMENVHITVTGGPVTVDVFVWAPMIKTYVPLDPPLQFAGTNFEFTVPCQGRILWLGCSGACKLYAKAVREFVNGG